MAADTARLKVASVPIENALFYLGMNVTKPPFNLVKVRQAMAYAMPYDKMWTPRPAGRLPAGP